MHCLTFRTMREGSLKEFLKHHNIWPSRTDDRATSSLQQDPAGQAGNSLTTLLPHQDPRDQEQMRIAGHTAADLLKILRVSMISLKATKFSMRHVNMILRPCAAGPAERSAGGTAGGGHVDSDVPIGGCAACTTGSAPIANSDQQVLSR